MDPKGHAAIVTGAASGLGAETAAHLAKAGAKVACLDINLDGAKAIADKIGGIAVRCDVTSSDGADAALKEARDKHGPARILVNCAGVGPAKRMVGRDGPMPLAEFEMDRRRQPHRHLQHDAACRRRHAERSPLAGGERGVIVSTASVAAYEGQIGQAPYAASKGGVAALTIPIARELSQFGIRVMAIAPGIFGTPMLQGAAAGGAGLARRIGAVPQAPRRAARIRRPGAVHHAQRLSQRRGDPARRRAPHGAALRTRC